MRGNSTTGGNSNRWHSQRGLASGFDVNAGTNAGDPGANLIDGIVSTFSIPTESRSTWLC